jgi:hypothetical protein
MRLSVVIALLSLSTAAVAAPLGDSVVLPVRQGMMLMDQCSRSVPEWDDFWTPDAAQIADLENGFEEAVAAELKKRGEQAPSAGFDRQYIGITVHGQKRIYVNAFIHALSDGKSTVVFPPRDFWRSNAVVVCDGGSYYFGAVFDPTTKTFSDFAFNGVT